MYSEREQGFGALTAELVRQPEERQVGDEAIDKLLHGTAWDYQPHRIRAGTAHVFTRPATLLESVRLDPERYRNDRHTLGFTGPDGERLLTYLVLRDVRTDDLRTLPEIESELRGAGRIRREDFAEPELRIIDRIWRPPSEIAEELGVSRKVVNIHTSHALRRAGVASRAGLTVVGLQEGFFTPDLEAWQTSRPRLSDKQAEVVRLAYLPSSEIGQALGISRHSVVSRLMGCYRKTGTNNRSELILASLANGECRLSELTPPRVDAALTARQEELVSLSGHSMAEIGALAGISEQSVSTHFHKIRAKLRVTTQAQVVQYAFREGYLGEADESLADVFDEEEAQVVRCLLGGNREIAERLSTSPTVVKQLLLRAKEKAGVESRMALVAYGLRAGLIEAERRTN